MTIRGTLKEVPYTVYTRYSWKWNQFQWKFLSTIITRATSKATPSPKMETKSTVEIVRTMEKEIKTPNEGDSEGVERVELGFVHKSTVNNPAAVDSPEATPMIINIRKPLSTMSENPEEITEDILKANDPILNFESKEAVTDEMQMTRRPTHYIAPWKKTIKSIDKTNSTSSAFTFSSTYISVALTHIIAALIVLLL